MFTSLICFFVADLSDPEDYLPTYDPDEDDDYIFVEDDLFPSDDNDLPPLEEGYSISESMSHVPFQDNSPSSSKRLFPADPKSLMLPDSNQLPVILPSQRAEYKAKKLRTSGQFGFSIGALLAGQAGGKPTEVSVGSEKEVEYMMRNTIFHSSESAQQPSRSSTVRRGSTIKIDNLKAVLDASGSQRGNHAHTLLEDHSTFSKYFKMLKADVPKELMALILTQDGFNGKIIQLDPLQPLPQENAEALEKKFADESLAHEEPGGASPHKVPVSQHPVYGKYFKMLKMGVPRSGVKQKLQADGLDISIIGLDPTTLVTLKERLVSQMTAAVKKTLQQVAIQDVQPPLDSTLKKKKKKKLFVEGIGADQISSESFWAKADDEDDDDEEEDAGDGTTQKKKKSSIVLDKDEFDKLFVEESTASSKIFAGVKVKASSIKPITVTASKLTQLISYKRAQNVSIIGAYQDHERRDFG